MRTRVVIQSRLNSSRLPGKALLTLGGMPLIELVARRASRAGHEVVVATSLEPYDNHIHNHLTSCGINVVRGPLDDVLGRFVLATADLDPGDRVVRLTGDNPVLDSDIIDELIAAMDESGHTYGRVDIEQVPEGLGCEVFTVDALRAANEQARASYDREHVTPWLRREYGELLFAPKNNPPDVVAYRCTVDSLADYDRACTMFHGWPDPVAVPWVELIGKLGRMLDEAGPIVPRVDRSEMKQSRLLLGAGQLGSDAGLVERVRPDAAQIRAIMAAAVVQGVSHVEAGRDDGGSEAAVRTGTEPALKQRIGLITRIASLRRVTPDALVPKLEASMERSFAELGRRKVDAVLLSSVSDADRAGQAAWKRLIKYRDDGLTGRIGVVLEDPTDVAWAERLPELGYLTLPFSVADRRWEEVQPKLQELSDRGVIVSVHSVYLQGVLSSTNALREDLPGVSTLRSGVRRAVQSLGRLNAADLCMAYVLGHPWVTSITIGAETEEQMVENMRLSAGEPLTPEEIAQVHEIVPPAPEELLIANGR
ncbi:aldo/keto reductase [Enemella sp. A6]|uniref:aldo/keto reductase n=1 Tax=Enemella sp. A6 TaxID=3440152 RepID=UPI003EB6A8E5